MMRITWQRASSSNIIKTLHTSSRPRTSSEAKSIREPKYPLILIHASKEVKVSKGILQASRGYMCCLLCFKDTSIATNPLKWQGHILAFPTVYIQSQSHKSTLRSHVSGIYGKYKSPHPHPIFQIYPPLQTEDDGDVIFFLFYRKCRRKWHIS